MRADSSERRESIELAHPAPSFSAGAKHLEASEAGKGIQVLDNNKVSARQAASRHLAIAKWDAEGSTKPLEPIGGTALPEYAQIPDLTNAELVQMRIRIIALENLLVALLSDATPAQRAAANEIMGLIVPQPGSYPHPLTLQAATHMEGLIGRARHFET